MGLAVREGMVEVGALVGTSVAFVAAVGDPVGWPAICLQAIAARNENDKVPRMRMLDRSLLEFGVRTICSIGIGMHPFYMNVDLP